MGYHLTEGDDVVIEYVGEGGEVKATRGVVEYNTTLLPEHEFMGAPKVKIKRGEGRTAHRVVLWPNGTLRVSPYLNANGRGEDGRLAGMSLVDPPLLLVDHEAAQGAELQPVAVPRSTEGVPPETEPGDVVVDEKGRHFTVAR